ncbi:MAG: ribosome biogenesis GTPase Der [bacterium]|nr:ribosome biogenesis GTPase Der [bacterium]MDD5354082.1 ribosome biogenesis GTPase Der [bacterium]
MNPVIAIVGRPNVGKSSLFNRLIGRRKALVHEIAGLTRDRLYGETIWNNQPLTIIDTGGYHYDETDQFLKEIKSQVHMAIDSADVIVFLVESRIPATPEERAIAKILHKSKKPVILAINKVDNPVLINDETIYYDNYACLGFREFLNISCSHGLNINTLLDKACQLLPKKRKSVEQKDTDSVKVAVIGKPNAGKSSLVNAILKEERVIVSPVAGTTRDSIDTFFEQDGQKFTLIDTAGIKKAKEEKNIAELLSILSAIRSMERADIALVVIDGENGVTSQDQRIADMAEQRKCACIIILNKWDTIVGKTTDTFDEYAKYIRTKLRFLHYAPILPISAKTKDRINTIIPEIVGLTARYKTKIEKKDLQEILFDAQSRFPVGHIKGRIMRVHSLEQIDSSPPVFRVLANEVEEFPKNYLRYLENRIREKYELDGVPMKFILTLKRKKG